MSTSNLPVTPGIGTKLATHRIYEDGVDKEMERIVAGAGRFEAWDNAATATTTGLLTSAYTPCEGKGRIIVSARAVTTEYDTVKLRVVFYSSGGDILCVSASIVISMSALLVSTKRVGSGVAFANDFGASNFSIYVEKLTSNNSTDFLLAAI